MNRSKDELSFWDHLEDLRRKLLLVLACFGLCFLASYFFFAQRVVEYLVGRVDQPLYYLSVFEPFLTRVKVSLSLAVLGTIPAFLVQGARFVLPGLYRPEKVLFACLGGLFLALVLGLGYLLLRFSPLLLTYFLKTFASPSVGYHLSVSTLVSFYIMLLLGDAIVILVPVVVFLLHKLGVITPEGIRSSRKILIPVFMFVGAVITPPDPFTMIAVALPLYLVFEGSLLLFRLVDRLGARLRAAEESTIR
jgi:sec-independent protein translocase protein TatC